MWHGTMRELNSIEFPISDFAKHCTVCQVEKPRTMEVAGMAMTLRVACSSTDDLQSEAEPLKPLAALGVHDQLIRSMQLPTGRGMLRTRIQPKFFAFC
jgi:hypothetical protein